MAVFSKILEKLGLFCLLLLAGLSASGGAEALDLILFPNGDTLSGRVVSEDESVVVFETEYLGILQVSRSQVILVRNTSEHSSALLPEAPSSLEHSDEGYAPSSDQISDELVFETESEERGSFNGLGLLWMTAEKTLNRFVHDRRPAWFPQLPKGWKGGINLGLNYNEAITINKRFYGDFYVEGDVGRSNWKGTSYFAFARANRTLNEDDWGASARWRFRLLETGFVETLATHDIDQVAEPARRSTGSIGFGFKPINRETLVFDYVLGGASESIENRIGISNNGFRISLQENLRWKLNSHMTLRQSLRLLIEPDSSMDYNYRFESGLDTLIIGALNLSVLYRVDYDTTIVIRENRQKTRIVTTIGIKF